VGVVSFSGITADEFNGDIDLQAALRMDLVSFAGVEKDAVSILDARDVPSSGTRRLFQTETIQVDYAIRYSSQSTAEDAAAVIEDVEELPEVEEYFASNGYNDVGYEVFAPTLLRAEMGFKENSGGEAGGFTISVVIYIVLGALGFVLFLALSAVFYRKRNGESRHPQKCPVPDSQSGFTFYENPQNVMMSSRAMCVSNALKNASPVADVDRQSIYDAV